MQILENFDLIISNPRQKAMKNNKIECKFQLSIFNIDYDFMDLMDAYLDSF